ncbi:MULTISPECIES: flagellar filament capping protein FliD [unclassified Campylobacter]|uniref:flagellar filament capping protein FliD n=1 Tax=unclassified Campylobacter TaxID=2593542 RepID=UPI003D3408D6
MAEVSSSTSSASTPTTSANTSKYGTLGLGSSNKLSDDLLNKLKAADEAAQVNPMTRKIEKNTDIKDDVNAVITLLNNVNSSFSKLTDESNYAKRAVSSTGTSASITVASGVSVQDLSLDVTQLAQRDSFKTNKFTSPSELIGITEDSNFEIEIRGVKHSIDVKASTTYQDLADMINERAGADVQARMINVGNGYQMVIQSASTGADQSFTLTQKTGDSLAKIGLDSTKFQDKDEKGNLLTNEDGSPKMTSNLEKNRLTTAQDAKFNYNGLEITRTTNKFDDLRSGISITLNEVGKSSFNVTQDTADLGKFVQEMVEQYNLLTENLDKATSYDSETGKSGYLQGINEITSIRQTLNRILTGQNDEGKSIDQYGVTMNEKGKLEFDASQFSAKLSADAEDVRKFFMGATTIETITYMGTSAVKDGALKLEAGDLVINGQTIKLEETSAGSSAKDNALALLKAINSAGVLGLNASLSPDETRIILKISDGADIEIKGKNNVLANFGMSEQTVNARSTTTEGLFTKLTKQVDKLTGEKGSLTLYSSNLVEENKKLEKEKEKAQTTLNEKYQSMRDTWSKYDAQIAKLENQFSTLKAMIDAELKSKD